MQFVTTLLVHFLVLVKRGILEMELTVQVRQADVKIFSKIYEFIPLSAHLWNWKLDQLKVNMSRLFLYTNELLIYLKL